MRGGPYADTVRLMGTGRSSLDPPRPPLADVLLAAALAVGAVLLANLEESSPFAVGRTVVALGSTLPLLWRRFAPVPVMVLMVAAQTALPWTVPLTDLSAPEFVGLFVATYTVAAHGTRRDLGLALTVLVVGFGLAVWRFQDRESLEGLVPVLVAHALVAVAGRAVRRREGDVRRLETEAVIRDLQRSREHEQAIRDERVRIARELHDLIAHGVSVMVVHAGAGQRQLAREPERARESLATIERVGRVAMDELQGLLELLRTEGAQVEPAVSLSHLDAVVEPVRAAGVDVTIEVVGGTDDLSPQVELCAYRVAQESLTNVVRHSGAQHAHLRIIRDDEAVVVEVCDDGAGSAGTDLSAADGHGLRGMAERLRMLGGRLHIGDGPAGGFRVRAWIPVAVRGD